MLHGLFGRGTDYSTNITATQFQLSKFHCINCLPCILCKYALTANFFEIQTFKSYTPFFLPKCPCYLYTTNRMSCRQYFDNIVTSTWPFPQDLGFVDPNLASCLLYFLLRRILTFIGGKFSFQIFLHV